MKKAEQFAKLNGIEPHRVMAVFTGVIFSTYHQYDNAKSILEVMMKRNDYMDFLTHLWNTERKRFSEISSFKFLIDLYILNPDKLLDEAIKFCEENKI